MSARAPRRGVFLLVLTLVLAVAPRARADGDRVPNVVVVDAEALGVAAESAAAVTRQLYATVARLGYLTVPETSARAASAPTHPGARTPSDLLQTAVATHADHAISAALGALGDRYAITVTLANADRTGPWTQTSVADSASLESAVDTMTRALLPPAPPPRPSNAASGASEALPTPAEPKTKVVHRLSLNTEGAVGLTSGVNESTSTERPTFYDQFVGPRFDYGFPNDFSVGAFVGYANLKGKEGRAHDVLTYLQLQYRARVSKSSDFRIPLRFASGYLPKNGPFIRVAAGVDIPLGSGVHLGLDLLAPALWVVRNRALLSIDWAAEVGFDL